MSVREIEGFLEQWQMNAKDLRRRMILAPTPRERERWYAILLPPQGQPGERLRIVCTRAGWPVVLPGPSAHGPPTPTNAQIRAVTHYPGGTLSLRHSGMFCRRP